MRWEVQNEIIGCRNHHSEQDLVSHVFLRMHQPPCLLHERPLAVLGLQELSPAVFVVGRSFGSVENDGYSGFDDHTLPDAEVDSTFSWYLRS